MLRNQKRCVYGGTKEDTHEMLIDLANGWGIGKDRGMGNSLGGQEDGPAHKPSQLRGSLSSEAPYQSLHLLPMFYYTSGSILGEFTAPRITHN